jgi:hypothetical protein
LVEFEAVLVGALVIVVLLAGDAGGVGEAVAIAALGYAVGLTAHLALVLLGWEPRRPRRKRDRRAPPCLHPGVSRSFGISAAAVGWRVPTFALALPGGLLINAVFFHVLPSIAARRPNPGCFTAVVLYLPIAAPGGRLDAAARWRVGLSS